MTRRVLNEVERGAVNKLRRGCTPSSIAKYMYTKMSMETSNLETRKAELEKEVKTLRRELNIAKAIKGIVFPF